jgi:hypothetical protein
MMDIKKLLLTDKEQIDIIQETCAVDREFATRLLYDSERVVAQAQLAKALWGVVDWLKWRGYNQAGSQLRYELHQAGIERL